MIIAGTQFLLAKRHLKKRLTIFVQELGVELGWFGVADNGYQQERVGLTRVVDQSGMTSVDCFDDAGMNW